MKNENEKAWKVLKSEPGADLGIVKYRFDYLENPKNGKAVRVTIIESLDAVNIVGLTKTGNLLMINQYRFGIGEKILEIPGGLVDEGEFHGDAAKRELMEETGYAGKDWHYLGKIPSNPVMMNSDIHHWLVKDVELVGATELEDAEDIQVKEIPLSKAKEMLKKGEIRHPHAVSAMVLAFEKI